MEDPEEKEEETNSGEQEKAPSWKSFPVDPATGYLKDPSTGELLDPDTGDPVSSSYNAVDF